MYGTDAESYQYPLWHVARAARGVSKILCVLFLGNGWADCVEILHAIGVPLVTIYAVVTGGVSMHVRSCKDTPHGPHSASVSQKWFDRLCSNLVCGLGVTKYIRAFHKSWAGWGISARAHVHPHHCIQGSD